jgi:ParB family transcriptional regulator, chromosome partitioning protein
MRWAEELKKEYSKIAKENSVANLPNGKNLPLGETGRVRDKIAQDLDMGSGENYRKAQYIYNNGNDELIEQLDEGQLSINKAYNTIKEQLKVKEMENSKLKRN